MGRRSIVGWLPLTRRGCALEDSEKQVVFYDRIEDSYAALEAIQTLNQHLDKGDRLIGRYRPLLMLYAWLQRAGM